LAGFFCSMPSFHSFSTVPHSPCALSPGDRPEPAGGKPWPEAGRPRERDAMAVEGDKERPPRGRRPSTKGRNMKRGRCIAQPIRGVTLRLVAIMRKGIGRQLLPAGRPEFGIVLTSGAGALWPRPLRSTAKHSLAAASGEVRRLFMSARSAETSTPEGSSA
jgi:hypothetical protein